MAHPKIVAIIAAYNLEDSIADIVKRTLQFVPHAIVVADGSSDHTAENARKSGAATPDPVMKRGKGYAVIKGIKASREYSPDIVILMDGDGQHLPEEIGKVIRPIIEEDIDMVAGSRMKGELRTSLVNKIGNVGLKIISFLVTGRWLTDTESGFHAFKASKLYSLKLSSTGYEFESELLLRAIKNKLTICEVPITVPFKRAGVTVRDGIKIGWYKIYKGIKIRFNIGE
jgi:glycosyltransferase involved in cell wall biosynthesis